MPAAEAEQAVLHRLGSGWLCSQQEPTHVTGFTVSESMTGSILVGNEAGRLCCSPSVLGVIPAAVAKGKQGHSCSAWYSQAGSLSATSSQHQALLTLCSSPRAAQLVHSTSEPPASALQ